MSDQQGLAEQNRREEPSVQLLHEPGVEGKVCTEKVRGSEADPGAEG